MRDDDVLKQLKLVQRRRRVATERLLGSSHLRDNLTDVQARPLLDWALRRLERDNLLAVDMDLAEAGGWFDGRVTAVADVVLCVNRLAGELATLPDARAEQEVVALMTRLQAVTGQPVDPLRPADLLDGRGVRSRDATVLLLLALLDKDVIPDDEEE